MNEPHSCPAFLISAPASGVGKTTIVAALAKYHTNQGKKVRVFKTGPDFLDPKILEKACGLPVYQLDLWMVGENNCKQLLYEAAKDADLILIEGVMGLFDGDPSSADLAKLFGIPIVAIINAEAMAQTFGAIALGLSIYDKDLSLLGVIANRVASTTHGEMLEDSIPKEIKYLGAISRDSSVTLPDRHLGLFQANEINDLEQRLEQAADLIEKTELANLPESIVFKPEKITAPEKTLKNIKIAIAKDDAFSFLYPANVDTLISLGAEITYFSPILDKQLPDTDCLYFPGGYPELFAEQLSKNKTLMDEIKVHHESEKPIVAECGGMMYLIDELITNDGNSYSMVGLIQGKIKMQDRLAAIGLQSMKFENEVLRGHTFHYSAMETEEKEKYLATRKYDGKNGEKIFKKNRLTASYIHWYFASNPVAAASLFNSDFSRS